MIGRSGFAYSFLRRSGRDEGNRVLFVLLSFFLCAVVARLVGVEDVIGAFLAGIAIDGVVGEGPVKEKTESWAAFCSSQSSSLTWNFC